MRADGNWSPITSGRSTDYLTLLESSLAKFGLAGESNMLLCVVVFRHSPSPQGKKCELENWNTFTACYNLSRARSKGPDCYKYKQVS